MKIEDLQKLMGQKIPGTHLTLLEDLGKKIYRGYKRRLFKVQCDCSVTREVPSYKMLCVGGVKTCGNLDKCHYAKELRKAAGVANSKTENAIRAKTDANLKRHTKAILLENKQHNFSLLKTVYNKYINGAKERSLEWCLTPQDIQTLWIEQNGRCNMTGLPLTCGTNYRNHTWSLDRIDNAKPYTKENVQIVSKAYNMKKLSGTDEEMRLMAFSINKNTPPEIIRKFNKMTTQEINEVLSKCANTSRNKKSIKNS